MVSVCIMAQVMARAYVSIEVKRQMSITIKVKMRVISMINAGTSRCSVSEDETLPGRGKDAVLYCKQGTRTENMLNNRGNVTTT
jgi:hypothetical protein